jgi:RNA polymerase sigma-70 factor (ECF subfamily)
VADQAIFDVLKGFLSGSENPESYKQVAARFNLTGNAIKMRVHRLKSEFGVLLRQEIAETVEEEDEIDPEIQHLFGAWD